MRPLPLIGAALLILLVALLGAFLWYRKASQPVHEGTFHVSGLTHPVAITRDAAGWPTSMLLPRPTRCSRWGSFMRRTASGN
jgi:hypothetical protein